MKSGIHVTRHSEFHVFSEDLQIIATVEWNGESGDDTTITLCASGYYELSTLELRKVGQMLTDISEQIEGEMADEQNP